MRRPVAVTDTLEALGGVTVQWLVDGRVDVDEDRAPGMTSALVALCQARAVAYGAQAGYNGPGFGDGYSRRLAWVGVLVDDGMLDVITRAVKGTPYLVVVHRPSRWRDWPEEVTITWRDGLPWDRIQGLGRRDLGRLYRGSIGHRARRGLVAAHQISIIDPLPSRNTLWAWLEHTITGGAR